MTDHCIISPGLALAAVEPFLGFSLHLKTCGVALLPSEHELVVNIKSGYFTVISWNVRQVVNDGAFSPEELPVALTLLNAWPSFVENNKLLQVMTKRRLEEVAHMLDADHEQAMEPLHRLVHACRHKLHTLGIEVEDMKAGYKLSPLRKGAWV